MKTTLSAFKGPSGPRKGKKRERKKEKSWEKERGKKEEKMRKRIGQMKGKSLARENIHSIKIQNPNIFIHKKA